MRCLMVMVFILFVESWTRQFFHILVLQCSSSSRRCSTALSCSAAVSSTHRWCSRNRYICGFDQHRQFNYFRHFLLCGAMCWSVLCIFNPFLSVVFRGLPLKCRHYAFVCLSQPGGYSNIFAFHGTKLTGPYNLGRVLFVSLRNLWRSPCALS